MSVREDLHRLVDRLPTYQEDTARRVLEALILTAAVEYDEEPLSSEEEAALEEGLRDIRAGRVKPLDEVLPPREGARNGG